MPDGREIPALRQKNVEASLSFNNMPSTIIPPLNQSNTVHRRLLPTQTIASRIALEAESLQQTYLPLQRSLSAGIAQNITLNGLLMGGGATHYNEATEVCLIF